MAKSLIPIQGIVKKIKDPESGEFGESLSVMAIAKEFAGRDKGQTPPDAFLWMRFKPDEYDQIPAMGTELTLIHSGKGKTYQIIGDDYPKHQMTVPSPTSQADPTRPTRDPIEEGQKYLQLYAHFRQAAIAQMPDAPPECIQAATASTLIYLDRQGLLGTLPDLSDPMPGKIFPGQTKKEDRPPDPTDPDSPACRFHKLRAWCEMSPSCIRDLCKANGLPLQSSQLSLGQQIQLRNLMFIQWGLDRGKFKDFPAASNAFNRIVEANPDSEDGGLWLAWGTHVQNKQWPALNGGGHVV